MYDDNPHARGRLMLTAAALPDWPPEGEPIGTERARAYVLWIKLHAPLAATAEAMLREQHPGSEPHTSASGVAHLATWTLDPGMAGLAIRCVWVRVQAGDFAMLDLIIRRDGRLALKLGRQIAG